MSRWRERFQRFMIGRYGMDQLNQFLLCAVLAMVVVDLFAHSGLLNTLSLAFLILCYIRMFSRNIGRRSQENQAYMNLRYKAAERLKGFRRKSGGPADRAYKVFKCPSCGQKIRIPRGHGKVSIHCPKCNKDFIKRT